MDEKKVINDTELKETIEKLLSDTSILIKIISKLQDIRYEYLTNALPIDFASKYDAEIQKLENELQLVDFK